MPFSRLVVRVTRCALLSGLASFPLLVAAFEPTPAVEVAEKGRHVVINIAQTRLFVFEGGKLIRVFPIAVGKQLTQTPTGNYAVTEIRRNPAWNVPASIQSEIRAKGGEVVTVVPPGPKNPLGPVFVRFGEPRLGLGMHGTNTPSSVPGFRSHGCVRLKSPDALRLASLMSIGVPVTVTYQPVLLNSDENGQLWLTAFADGYRRTDGAFRQSVWNEVETWAKAQGKTVNRSQLDQTLSAKSGEPVCLSCLAPKATPRTVTAQDAEPAAVSDKVSGGSPLPPRLRVAEPPVSEDDPDALIQPTKVLAD